MVGVGDIADTGSANVLFTKRTAIDAPLDDGWDTTIKQDPCFWNWYRCYPIIEPIGIDEPGTPGRRDGVGQIGAPGRDKRSSPGLPGPPGPPGRDIRPIPEEPSKSPFYLLELKL